MDCPVCKTEGFIESSVIKTENDNTPDKKTVVYRELTITCRNDKCVNYGKNIGTIKNVIYEGTV